MAHIHPKNTESLRFKNLEFVDNFRDDKLRINDDRKVKLNLKDFTDDEGTIIIFLVRTFDNRKEKPAEDAYTQSWFRLQNEETNQTLDYTKLNKLELPQGYEENPEGDGENQEER